MDRPRVGEPIRHESIDQSEKEAGVVAVVNEGAVLAPAAVVPVATATLRVDGDRSRRVCLRVESDLPLELCGVAAAGVEQQQDRPRPRSAGRRVQQVDALDARMDERLRPSARGEQHRPCDEDETELQRPKASS